MNNKTTTKYNRFAKLSQSEILSQKEIKPMFVPYEENIYLSNDPELQAHWDRRPDESKKEYVSRLGKDMKVFHNKLITQMSKNY